MRWPGSELRFDDHDPRAAGNPANLPQTLGRPQRKWLVRLHSTLRRIGRRRRHTQFPCHRAADARPVHRSPISRHEDSEPNSGCAGTQLAVPPDIQKTLAGCTKAWARDTKHPWSRFNNSTGLRLPMLVFGEEKK